MTMLSSSVSVKSYIYSGGIDLVYSREDVVSLRREIVFDLIPILSNGSIRCDIRGIANFVIPHKNISVETTKDGAIIVLDKFDYKGFEQKEYDYIQKTFLKATVSFDKLGETNKLVGDRLDTYMKTVYILENKNEIKGEIIKKLQAQLNEKFPQLSIEVKWKT
jgi:hypothetical protein